jgi:hypothetical protein
MFYQARWYDPTLGRFAQADSIIPEASQGVQAWDRYAGMNNNAVKYTDPSGHCIGILSLICTPLAIIAGTYGALNGLGVIPDYQGAVKATMVMGKDGNIAVGAALAVQGEWAGFVDNVIGDVKPGSSGYGLAQTNSQEISSLGLGNLNPQNPGDAVQVMEARISAVQNACTGCDEIDLLIAGALAQNRSITRDQMAKMSKGGGGINWENFLKGSVSPGQLDARIRQALTGLPFDRRYILLKYIQDMRLLYKWGWTLPDNIDEDLLDDMENTARTGNISY